MTPSPSYRPKGRCCHSKLREIFLLNYVSQCGDDDDDDDEEENDDEDETNHNSANLKLQPPDFAL